MDDYLTRWLTQMEVQMTKRWPCKTYGWTPQAGGEDCCLYTEGHIFILTSTGGTCDVWGVIDYLFRCAEFLNEMAGYHGDQKDVHSFCTLSFFYM